MSSMMQINNQSRSRRAFSPKARPLLGGSTTIGWSRVPCRPCTSELLVTRRCRISVPMWPQGQCRHCPPMHPSPKSQNYAATQMQLCLVHLFPPCSRADEEKNTCPHKTVARCSVVPMLHGTQHAVHLGCPSHRPAVELVACGIMLAFGPSRMCWMSLRIWWHAALFWSSQLWQHTQLFPKKKKKRSRSLGEMHACMYYISACRVLLAKVRNKVVMRFDL
jgi:hypothetical protein